MTAQQPTTVSALPKMRDCVAGGLVTRWIRSADNPVIEDQTLLALTTGEVDTEISSLVTEVPREQFVAEHGSMPIGTPIAAIKLAQAHPAATIEAEDPERSRLTFMRLYAAHPQKVARRTVSALRTSTRLTSIVKATRVPIDVNLRVERPEFEL